MENTLFKITTGIDVIHQGAEYQVLRILDMYSVIGLNIETKKPVVLQISEISPKYVANHQIQKSKEVHHIEQFAWDTAMRKYNIIKPLLELEKPGKKRIKQHAAEQHVNYGTIYRWLKKYRQTGSVSGLLDQPRGGAGLSRTPEHINEIVTTIIQQKYLNKQKLNGAKIYEEILLTCRRNEVKAPCYSTVLDRINKISAKEKTEKRVDKYDARNKFSPVGGHFSGGDTPLSVIQIDHTLLDIILVDEINRNPIGRPWLTVAIDVFSRMVTGFYISLDPPGTLGTGLCIASSILPKEMWLTQMGVEGGWPCYGIMSTIHLDNAREFHGLSLQRSCQEYGIEINFRPVKKPNYGGHIERLMGTFAKEIHALPGTTFSTREDRKHYDSEAMASFTTKELEKWLLTFIVGVYHQRQHHSLKCSPIAKYTSGILGDGIHKGVGVSRPIYNEWKVKLDFMPVIPRKIAREGVLIDNIYYYHDIFKKWIARGIAKRNSKPTPNFIFKRDPRDISVIYFYDPELLEYYPVPYRNITLPSITLWECKEIIKKLKSEGRRKLNEDIIFSALEQMRQIEQQVTDKTKTARINKVTSRRRQALNNSVKADVIAALSDNVVIDSEYKPSSVIKPFEDIDYESFK